MPQRQQTKTIKGGPQGHDAFFIRRFMTIDESQHLNTRVPQAYDGDPDDLAAVKAHEKAETEASLEENLEYLSTIIVDWNWVDDDGTPLPKPKGNPAAFRLLNEPEIDWITRELRADDDAEKKGKYNSPRR